MIEDTIDGILAVLKQEMPQRLEDLARARTRRDKEAWGRGLRMAPPNKYVYGPPEPIPEGDYPVIAVVQMGDSPEGSTTLETEEIRIEIYTLEADRTRTSRVVARYTAAIKWILGNFIHLRSEEYPNGLVKRMDYQGCAYETRQDGGSLRQRSVLTYAAQVPAEWHQPRNP